MNLTGKTALVTGAGTRLGQAIALELGRAGCHVAVHFSGSREGAAKTVALLNAMGVRALDFKADLTCPKAATHLIPRVVSSLGPLDILVNNAGIFLDGGLMDEDTHAWESQFALNLRAPYLLCKAFASARADTREGRVLNILDARINRTGTDHFIYRLTKHALAEMTRMLALELAPHTTVNGISPGAILAPPGHTEAYLDQLARERIPLKRAGHPSLLATNARQLLEQDFVTGVILTLDGGEYLG